MATDELKTVVTPAPRAIPAQNARQGGSRFRRVGPLWAFTSAILILMVALEAYRWAMPRTRVEPGFVEIPEVVTEGDIVKVPLAIHNSGWRDIRVVNATTTCGCTSLITTGGKKFSAPITIHPGKTLSWQAEIDTRTRIGQSTFVAAFDISDGVFTTRSSAAIAINTIIDWGVLPGDIVTPAMRDGEKFTGQILVTDSNPAELSGAKEVRSSNPKVLTASMSTVGKKDDLVAVHEADLKRIGGSPVQKVTFIVRPPANVESGQEWLTLVPREEKRQPLRVSVQWSTKSERIQVSPGALFIQNSEWGKSLKRRLHCTFPATNNRIIGLASDPKNVATAVISKLSPTESAIDLDFVAPSEGQERKLVFVFTDTAQVAFAVPIRSAP